MKRLRLLLVVLVLSLAGMACGLFSFSREGDGTFLVETTLPLQVIQGVLENAVDMTQVVDLQLELQEGFIFVSAASVEIQGITARDVSFHLELFAVNGKLSARITNVKVSDNLFDEALFEQFNQMIADRLSAASQENERAELVDVSISPDGVKMTWRIDPNLGE